MKFSLEIFLNKQNIFKLINIIKIFYLKPNFITITYNRFKINKKLINYFLKKKIKIFFHMICKKNIFNFNYLINYYYLNNLKNFVLIKGDQQKKNNSYYSYNFLYLIKKNYKNNLKIILGVYPEKHLNNINNYYDYKSYYIKNKILFKNILFFTQYFYNIETYYYFLDNFFKIKKIKIIPGVLPLVSLKSLISFSNMCKSDLPIWIFKNIESILFLKNNKILEKMNLEILINLILKLFKFKSESVHIYTMQKLYTLNIVVQKLKILINL